MKKQKRKIKLNKKGKTLVASLLLLSFLLIGCFLFGFFTNPVSKDATNKLIIIENGDTYSSIASFLQKQNLIRSDWGYKIYLKLNAPKHSLKAGKHYLRENMTLKQIIAELGTSPNDDNVTTITFKEGFNIRSFAKTISEKTNYQESEVLTLLKDKTFLDSLIKKYWFLTEEIKNEHIYYSLEGYLYPNTYEFTKEASLKEMIQKILDETERKLTPYKSSFEASKYTVHQILTLASISELEAVTENDREQVARVFYNRLNSGMSLGSDVTTYYAAGIDMGDRDLYQSELDAVNAYNTRSAALAGKLPIGPICNPSISAIKTAINPKKHDYLFFVADKNRKVYFTKTSSEHDQIISKLMNEGLWYTYE